MPPVDCKSQPKLSNVEHCPGKCPNNCTNGYCDCATGECLCNPGFSGSKCKIDTCAAAGCVNGNCVAQYLGRDLLVTKKPCVCIDGWYGDRCDTTTPPLPVPEPSPNCFNGFYFFPDSEFTGRQLGAIQTSDPKACCVACNADPACNSWVLSGICFLKTGTQRLHKPGRVSGIKCSVGIGSSTNPPVLTTTPTNAPITVTVTSVSASCDGRCKGQYPYSCNSGFPIGYCNAGGGCSYSPMNGPSWCCFKGC